MLRIFSVTILVALIGILLLGPGGEWLFRGMRSKEANAKNEQGLSYRLNREAEGAIRSFQSATDLEPFEPVYHQNLAQIYTDYPEVSMRVNLSSLEDVYREVMRELLIAKILAPEDIEAARDYAQHFAIADSFGAAPNWEKAVIAWEDCLRLADREYKRKPTYVNKGDRMHALLQLGRAEIKAGRANAAVEHLREALKIKPESYRVMALLTVAETSDTQTPEKDNSVYANGQREISSLHYILTKTSTTNKRRRSEAS